MALDPAEEGEITTTTLDDSGEVRCKVDATGGEELDGIRLRSPMGSRARPLDADADGGADCLFQRNGDEGEVLVSVDRAVVDKLHQLLGALPKGSYQIHSLGNAPQSITMTDERIQIGNKTDGEKAAARVDDHVNCGRIRVIAAAKKLDVFYIPPGGAAPPLPAPPATGLLFSLLLIQSSVAAPVGAFDFPLEGLIDKGSKLVKIAGQSV